MPDIKIVALSDSHGRSELVRRVSDMEKPYDLMVHCGDIVDMSFEHFELESGLPFLAVRGNCDYDPMLPAEITHDIGDKRIFITHGHTYGVKWGVRDLILRAQRNGAYIALFGHTHEPYLERDKGSGIYILNPGSIARPRQRSGIRTYAVIKLSEGDEPEFEFRQLQ